MVLRIKFPSKLIIDNFLDCIAIIITYMDIIILKQNMS